MAKRIIVDRSDAFAYGYVKVAVFCGEDDEDQAVEIDALVDTGADYTIIDSGLLEDLGIATSGKKLAFAEASSEGKAGSAIVTMAFVGTTGAGKQTSLVNTKEVAVADMAGKDMLLGMDVLGCFDLSFLRDGRMILEW